jgi:hypothetical protein
MKRYKLNVPYSDKNEAKNLGAKWDFDTKTWYVLGDCDLSKFDTWNPIVQDWIEAIKNAPIQKTFAKARTKVFKITGAPFKPLCFCTTPPWDDCEHTIQVGAK